MLAEKAEKKESNQKTPMVCGISYESYHNGEDIFGYVFSEKATNIIKKTDLLIKGKLKVIQEYPLKRYTTTIKLQRPSKFIRNEIPWADSVVFVGVRKNNDWNKRKHEVVIDMLKLLGWTENLQTVKLVHW